MSVSQECIPSAAGRYGTVTLTLKEYLNRRSIPCSLLAKRTGISCWILRRYMDGEVSHMDLKILARICCALDCGIGDILNYEPGCQNR